MWSGSCRGSDALWRREVPVRFGWCRMAVVWALAGSLMVAAAVASGAQGGSTFGDIGDAGVYAGSVEALTGADRRGDGVWQRTVLS